jgi:hypothetical protein
MFNYRFGYNKTNWNPAKPNDKCNKFFVSIYKQQNTSFNNVERTKSFKSAQLLRNASTVFNNSKQVAVPLPNTNNLIIPQNNYSRMINTDITNKPVSNNYSLSSVCYIYSILKDIDPIISPNTYTVTIRTYTLVANIEIEYYYTDTNGMPSTSIITYVTNAINTEPNYIIPGLLPNQNYTFILRPIYQNTPGKSTTLYGNTYQDFKVIF